MVIRTLGPRAAPSRSAGGQHGDVGDRGPQRVGDRGDAEVGDGVAAGAEQHRGDVGDDLVDQAGPEERGGQGRRRPRGRRAGGRGRTARRAPRAGRGCAGGAVSAASSKIRRPGSRSRSPITTRSGWRPSGSVVLVADGERGVVDGDGVGADQHHVAQRPQPVRVAAGRGAGDPAAGAVGGGAAAVERGGELPGDERAAVLDRERPDPVQVPGLARPAGPARPRCRPPRRVARPAGGDRVAGRPARTPRGVRPPRPAPARTDRCGRCGCRARA